LIVSDGKKLTVREISEPLMEFRSWGIGEGPPLPILNRVYDREKSRDIIRGIMSGDYNRVK